MNNELDELLVREKVREKLLYSVRLLDSKQYDEFIKLFAENGRYILTAESKEIRHNMTWLDVSKTELAELLEESPKHIHDMAERTHILSVGELHLDASNTTVIAESTFSVFRTAIDGRTQVYAVGYYNDELTLINDEWKINQRHVKVQTRLFKTPTPTPL